MIRDIAWFANRRCDRSTNISSLCLLLTLLLHYPIYILLYFRQSIQNYIFKLVPVDLLLILVVLLCFYETSIASARKMIIIYLRWLGRRPRCRSVFLTISIWSWQQIATVCLFLNNILIWTRCWWRYYSPKSSPHFLLNVFHRWVVYRSIIVSDWSMWCHRCILRLWPFPWNWFRRIRRIRLEVIAGRAFTLAKVRMRSHTMASALPWSAISFSYILF